MDTPSNKPMQIWQTLRNSDETEGRGPRVPDLAFLHKEHADRYINEQPGVQGFLGRKGGWEITPINVIDYDIVQVQVDKVKIRQEALKKLSKEEKDALGLTFT